MPRKSKSWKDEAVKSVLESYGLLKVSFDLNGEMMTVATNDNYIRDFLNPHHDRDEAKTCAAPGGTHDSSWFSNGMKDAWQTSRDYAEAQWTEILESAFELTGYDKKIDEVLFQGGKP